MRMTGVASSWVRNWRTRSRTSRSRVWWARARSLARWITGPSAMGSEKGTPSSMRSAPAATMACIKGTVVARSGSPAVTKGMRAVRPRAVRSEKRAAMRLIAGGPHERRRCACPCRHAPGKIDEDDLVLTHGRRQLDDLGQGVAGLQRRDDALGAGQDMEGGQGLVVGDGDVLGAAAVLEPGMLGPDAGVVEAGGDGVGLDDLAVVVLHQIGAVTVQHPGPARAQGRRVVAGLNALPRRLDADQRPPPDRRGRGRRGRWRCSHRRRRPPGHRAAGPTRSSIWARDSRPITAWKSRTMAG